MTRSFASQQLIHAKQLRIGLEKVEGRKRMDGIVEGRGKRKEALWKVEGREKKRNVPEASLGTSFL